jgi:hypothetical protein
MSHSAESGLEPLHLIEAGSLPRVETAMLKDLLARGSVQRPSRDEVNAHKHRLHGLRCENFSLRIHIHELETRINQMCATRGWKTLEKIRWWRRTVLEWLPPFLQAKRNSV